eukprot:1847709-Amphidinium_carterae.1
MAAGGAQDRCACPGPDETHDGVVPRQRGVTGTLWLAVLRCQTSRRLLKLADMAVQGEGTVRGPVFSAVLYTMLYARELT